MSLGSRIVKRGRVAAIPSLASTPREPLLFLYPQWIRNSSTASIRPAFDRDRNLSTPSVRHTDTPSVPGTQVLQPAISKESTEPSSGKNKHEEIHGESTGTNSAGNAHTTEDDARPITSQPTKITTDPTKNRVGRTPELTPNVPIIRRLYQASLKARHNAVRERSVKKAYQTYKREQMRSWDPDWRVILSDLSTHTPKNEKWLDQALNVVVPESAAGKFLYGVDTNMWDIGERYGCSIELNGRNPETGEYRSFLLSGSATAIRKTTADILRIAPETELKPTTHKGLVPTGIKTNAARSNKANEADGGRDAKVRTVKSGGHRRIQTMRADKVPRPTEWTQQSFADYVTDLTSVEMPNHIHRLIYKNGETHVSAVIAILRKIFQDPDCRSSISRKAFNTAMAYFIKANQIEDARIFFVHMEMMKIQSEVETFNIMLRGAAKSEDLHNFHFILHLMLRRGISPNYKTWIAFMMAIPDLRIKLYILTAMRERGLLRHIATMRAVCEQLVSQEISTSLDNGQSQDEFLRHMDSRYGTSWLTVSSANRILDALGERGLVSRSWDFLDVMSSRFVKPDHVSIDMILNHCKHSMNVTGAIEVMKSISPSIGFVPHEDTYHILFELAWRSRSYNLARVVWRYACLNALTTWKMRIRVMSSVRAAHLGTEHGTNSHRRWDQQAGLFILGNGNLSDRPMLLAGPVAGDEITGSLPVVVKKSPSKVSTRVDVTLERLDKECSVFQHWEPVKPLADLLEEAWERDKEWKSLASSALYRESWGLEWKLERAVSVPVQYKDASTSGPKTVEWA
jgi:pentatricopeptide repeat protein